MNYKEIIAKALAQATGLPEEQLYNLLEVPPKADMGDFAFPCFTLAKTLKKAPPVIAQDLAQEMTLPELEKVEALGPYLNFFLKKGAFAGDVVARVLKEGEDYGKGQTGQGKTILVDYSSPNIAKPFSVALMYTTCLGNALVRMFNSEGYDTVGINHLGDYGTQFGKLIYAYGAWGDEKALEEDPIKELLRIYVKYHQEAEADPKLDDKAREHFKNLEDGKEYEVGLWTRFKDLSLKDFQKVYDLLDIHFEAFTGEAFYSPFIADTVKELKDKDLLTESQGAQVVMLDDFNMPPAVILKSDGSSIYCTRDVTAAMYRKRTYDFYKCLYVVGNPQALHFKQVFKVLELMGKDWAKDCVHVGFGLVKFQGQKFSTREGKVFYLTDLLAEAVQKAREIIEEKNPDLDNKEEVAQKIGLGGVKFIYLKNSRDKDILFDMNEVLNFDGETAPYVQYTYARGRSILRKNGTGETTNLDRLSAPEEFELAKLLAAYQDVKKDALAKYEPSVFTRYILDIAKAFNKFYNNINIQNSQEEDKKARLSLVEATCQVLKNGLNLLGIDVVERM